MTKGLEVCGGASTGVQDSAGSQGHDSIPPLGPEPLRAIVDVEPVWTSHGTVCFYCLPNWVSTFQLEFGLLRDRFKFRGLHVPRVMVEEQHNVLGMLTQALAQVVERLVATEARDEERLTMEQETMEIQRAHLAMARRATDREEEWLELERVQTSIAQQQTEDL